MKTVHTFFTTISLIAIFSTAIVRGQNLIVDGSFESPSEPTNGVYIGVSPTGWTGGVRLYRGTTGHPGFPAPEDGNQYEGIETSSISQTFNIVNAGLYRLTWYDATAEGESYLNTITIKNATTTLFTTTSGGIARLVWNEHTAEIALGPGADTLEFNGAALGTVHLLDNISLVQIPDVANSASLLLIAFASLVAMQRKIVRI